MTQTTIRRLNTTMLRPILLLSLTALLSGCKATDHRERQPEVRIRTAPPVQFRGANSASVDKPGECDCNNPLHWDGDTLYVFNSAGHPWRSSGADLLHLTNRYVRCEYDTQVNGGAGSNARGRRRTEHSTDGINDRDNGWNPIARHEGAYSSSSRPTYYARASANGYAALELDFLLYGVAGTYAKPKAYVGFELELLADTWLSVYWGISASAGIKAGIYSYTLQHDFGVLFDYRETLYALRGNKPPMISSFTASPSTVATQGTSAITVVASDAENDPFTCTWSTDGGTLSSTAWCGSSTWTAPQAPGTYTARLQPASR